MSTPARKGARRTAEIPQEVLLALERGEMESATLIEGMAFNQAALAKALFPRLSATAREEVHAAAQLGILKRMGSVAALLHREKGTKALDLCASHGSDTARGWACFMIGQLPDLSAEERLEAIRPFADDAHFGVREWAWLAVRPALAVTLEESIALLTPWTLSPSERIRRFACETLRPRGVWCAHLSVLKQTPELGLPLLEPLKADSSVYVQDSVANWLNDAAKDHPDWVQDLCKKWLKGAPPKATERICTRALRSIKAS